VNTTLIVTLRAMRIIIRLWGMRRVGIGRGKKEIVSRIRVRGVVAWGRRKNVLIRTTMEKRMTEKRR